MRFRSNGFSFVGIDAVELIGFLVSESTDADVDAGSVASIV